MHIPLSHTISTERLILKHVAEADIPFVFDATRFDGFNDGMQWEPPATPEELLPNLKTTHDAWLSGEGYGFSAWTDEPDPIFVGRLSIRRTEQTDVWDIGYWTHPNLQKKGYTTEAVDALICFGFDQLNAVEIEACYATWNLASGRVLEKTGMVQRAFIEKGFKKRGVWVPEYRMSIYKTDWKRLNKNG